MDQLSASGVLKIYLGEKDRLRGKPLFEVLVQMARERGLSGATVFRSPMGFGSNSILRTASVLSLSTDLPVVVEVVDTMPRLRDFAGEIRALWEGGLVTLQEVEIFPSMRKSEDT